MYTLKESLLKWGTILPQKDWNDSIVLVEANAQIAYGTNITMGYLKCYTFTIIERGWVTLKYGAAAFTAARRHVCLFARLSHQGYHPV